MPQPIESPSEEQLQRNNYRDAGVAKQYTERSPLRILRGDRYRFRNMGCKQEISEEIDSVGWTMAVIGANWNCTGQTPITMMANRRGHQDKSINSPFLGNTAGATASN